jgi:ATP adenylyltransferase
MEKLWAGWRMTYIKSAPTLRCLFCGLSKETPGRANLILERTAHAFLVLNAFPYNSGHLMVAPLRHVKRMGLLTREERLDFLDLLVAAESILDRAYRPQGMNVGYNQGRVAGAGVPGHLHMHFVPRWHGDTNFMPVLGETKVLPESLGTSYRRLRTALREHRRLPGPARPGGNSRTRGAR